MDTDYTDDTSCEHIQLSGVMDYPMHAWACREWGYGPTATARALVLTDTLGEANQFLADGK